MIFLINWFMNLVNYYVDCILIHFAVIFEKSEFELLLTMNSNGRNRGSKRRSCWLPRTITVATWPAFRIWRRNTSASKPNWAPTNQPSRPSKKPDSSWWTSPISEYPKSNSVFVCSIRSTAPTSLSSIQWTHFYTHLFLLLFLIIY